MASSVQLKTTGVYQDTTEILDLSTDGNATVKGTVTILGADTAAATLYLKGDNGDDAGDEWKLNVSNAGVLTLGNDIDTAGTHVAFMTMTPDTDAASSTTAFAGDVTVAGNMTVTGTTTTVNTVTMNAQNAVVFEGSTADSNETTLTIEDPTADRTVVIPNVSGTLAVLAADSDTAITATPGEINLIDGNTARGTTAVASGDGILINDAGTMRMTNVDTVSTYFASHSVGGTNIVTVGALDAGSITSNFGTINTGASAITTTGLGTFGSLDVDHVMIDGTTIGHTDDTDLMTLANAALTLKGTLTVGVDDTGHDVKLFGATSGAYLEWDESADELELRGGAATPGKLLLSTAETTVVDGNKLGQIDFQAPLDSAGTDAILVGASIWAEADDTFAADNNDTDLVFATGKSEAAAEKMRLNSDGDLAIAGDLTITGGNIKSAITCDSTVTISTIAEVGSDTDKFLMSDSGVVKYATGANVASYIGAVTTGTTSTFTAAQRMDDDTYLQFGANADYGIKYDETTSDSMMYGTLTEGAAFQEIRFADQYDDGGDAWMDQIAATGGVRVFANDIGTKGTFVAQMTLTPTAGSEMAEFKKDVHVGDDCKLVSDGAILGFGANNDVTVTHVHDTGLLLNGTMALQFNDASQYINAPTNEILDINATAEVEINATLCDVNANLDVSGTYTGGGLMTTGGSIVIPDAGTIGSASDTDAIAISSGGVVSVSATTAASSTTSGALTVAGGVGIAADLYVGDDLELDSDAAKIGFGADSDVSLTHVADTGLLLNSSRQIQFGDSATHIKQVSDSNLEVEADGSIILDSPVVDFQDDGVVAKFGDDSDVTLTHVADTGLRLNAAMKLQFRDAAVHVSSDADGYLNLQADTGITMNINGTDQMTLTAAAGLVLPNNATYGVAKATAFVTYSDETLKHDITTLQNPLDKVMAMRGVSYTWNSDNTNDIGFIAQEIQDIVPEVVYTGGDDSLGIDYASMTAILVEAIKEQQTQISDLKALLVSSNLKTLVDKGGKLN